MSDDQKEQEDQPAKANQPIFLLPSVVTILGGIMVALQAASEFLGPRGVGELTFWLGFIPLRIFAGLENPADWVPLIWTPFTHAFLHAGWEHLFINVAWLAIFGTPVARRYGARATVALFLVAAAAGAAAYVLTDFYSVVVLVGASGGVAGLTGAAVRFIFQPVVYGRDPETGLPVALGRRLASLADVFRKPRSRWFTLIWIGLNAAIPLLPALGGASINIAWQAHLGGFLAGLLLVPLFERRS